MSAKVCDVCGKAATQVCAGCKKVRGDPVWPAPGVPATARAFSTLRARRAGASGAEYRAENPRQVRYCSRPCQVSDWKRGHKAACGAAAGAAPADALSGTGGTCTRCLKANDKSVCRVEHPAHLRADAGGFFGGDRHVRSFGCTACGKSFALVSTVLDDGRLTAERLEGAKWCFEGRHSSAELEASDRRRVIPHAVALEAGPALQRQLDSIPSDTETLTVSAAMYEDEVAFKLDKHLPKLQTLALIDVPFSKVMLNERTTPALRSLQLQNLPNSCDIEVVCPELRTVTLHYWQAHGKPHVVDNMLRAATKLEVFDSYKLWSNQRLCFASPALRSIDLHRADCLRSLSIWAPKLTTLGLQACYSLESIEFLPTHPLAEAAPAGPACRAPLRVCTTNANLGAAAARALREHPRVAKSGLAHVGGMAATCSRACTAAGAATSKTTTTKNTTKRRRRTSMLIRGRAVRCVAFITAGLRRRGAAGSA